MFSALPPRPDIAQCGRHVRFVEPWDIWDIEVGTKIKAWLARRPHYHVHFTPTSASWINQVERWFAELTEKQIQRGVH
jgi:hypothetical protein